MRAVASDVCTSVRVRVRACTQRRCPCRQLLLRRRQSPPPTTTRRRRRRLFLRDDRARPGCTRRHATSVPGYSRHTAGPVAAAAWRHWQSITAPTVLIRPHSLSPTSITTSTTTTSSSSSLQASERRRRALASMTPSCLL